jgi:hypothetical protein
MLATYVRKLFIGTVAATVMAGVACSASPTKRSGTGGAGSTGAAGATAAAGTTGAAGSPDTAGTTGAAGSSDTAGTTGAAGAAGATTGAAGTTATAGTTGAAGATATGGDTGAAGTTTPPVDNVPISPLPVAVTEHWYPSGWDADDYTKPMFKDGVPWTIVDQSMAVPTTGPCANRVAGALGHCFKITYTPLTNPAGLATHASVSLLSGASNLDPLMAPRVAPGAKRLAGRVAGAVGGEAVLFNLGSNTDPASYQFATLALTTAWQKIEITLDGLTYDHFLSPFGFGTMSTTPITFYYDDLRFDTTPVTQP